tara:strand:+ start:201 stop:428 length:228 start_codon:yes stop_codon:yes gene_type:complete
MNKERGYNPSGKFLEDEYYTQDQISQITGLSQSTVIRMRKKYNVSGFRFGRNKLFIGNELNNMMKQKINGIDPVN